MESLYIIEHLSRTNTLISKQFILPLEYNGEKTKRNVTIALLILKEFEKLNMHACIAGGFPTYMHGKTTTFNDIDIFVNTCLKSFNMSYIEKHLPTYNYAYKINNRYAYCYLKLYIDYKHIIDLIFKEKNSFSNEHYAFTIIDKFDIQICKHALFYFNNRLYILNDVLNIVGHELYVNYYNQIFQWLSLRTLSDFTLKTEYTGSINQKMFPYMRELDRNRIEKYASRKKINTYTPNTLAFLCYKILFGECKIT